MTRAFQRTKERPLISTGTQKPKRWPTHGDPTRSVTRHIYSSFMYLAYSHEHPLDTIRASPLTFKVERLCDVSNNLISQFVVQLTEFFGYYL